MRVALTDQAMDESTSVDAEDVDAPEEAVDAQRRQRQDLAILLALPVVILMVLRASPYFRLNNGDPFIYAGYSNDFRGHIQRFGYTYHSVRFGLIFPLRVSLIFGQIWGYFILRYVLYLVATVPMYFAFRPYGRRAALLGPTLFIANPVTTLAILTTHPDTIVVPLYAAMLSLLILAYRRRGWRVVVLTAAAGVLAGIAVNANIFFAPLLTISLALFALAFVVERRWIDGLSACLVFGLSALAASVAGMLVYRSMFGDANIYQTTFNAINDIHGSNLWKAPSRIWLTTRRYVYAPPLAVLAGSVAVVRARRDPRPEKLERGLIVSFLAVPLVYYLFQEFVQQGTTIETSYYYDYIIGPTCIVVAAAFGWSRLSRSGPIALVIVVPVVVAFVSQLFEVRPFLVFVLIVAAAAAVIIRSRTIVAIAALVVAMNIAWGSAPRNIAAIPNATFQYEPHYEIAFGDFDDTGFEVYELASRLSSVVLSNPGAQRPLLFWYQSGDEMLDSVEASYHWETLAVQRSPAPGMPEISDGDLDRLRSVVGGYLVLMGHEQSELDAGVAKLVATGFVVEPAEATRLVADNSSVLVESVLVVSAP